MSISSWAEVGPISKVVEKKSLRHFAQDGKGSAQRLDLIGQRISLCEEYETPDKELFRIDTSLYAF